MPIQKINEFATGAQNLGASIGGNLGRTIGAVGGLVKLGTAAFSRTLPKGGVPSSTSKETKATFSGPTPARDWRVKLSIPLTENYTNSYILAPLKTTNGLVFPYTPSITISHTASYQSLEPVHNNYPFVSYENSKIDRITIVGDFYCEDSTEAAYWVAAVHYLRSVTKMFYGPESENAGAPPPIVKLNGYGDFVFNNVPVVVTNFSIDLPKDVDYIATKFDTGFGIVENFVLDQDSVGYAPVKSTLTVTLQPAYSRTKVRNFNLNDFVYGAYINSNDGGFI